MVNAELSDRPHAVQRPLQNLVIVAVGVAELSDRVHFGERFSFPQKRFTKFMDVTLIAPFTTGTLYYWYPPGVHPSRYGVHPRSIRGPSEVDTGSIRGRYGVHPKPIFFLTGGRPEPIFFLTGGRPKPIFS